MSIAIELTEPDSPEPETPHSHDIQIGTTLILRDSLTAHRESLFMARVSERRLIKLLRKQMDTAQRRHFKTTRVPVDVLERLLTKLENADA